MGDARRTQRGFPAANHGLRHGDGEKQVGFANVVVVEEIHDVGAEVVGVEHPSAIGDGDAELMFFIALAVERDESQAIGVGKLQQGAGRCDERRGLVVVAVESAKGPLQTRHGERCAEARADGGFCNAAGEMRGAHAGGQRQPGRHLEFVVKKECQEIAGRGLRYGRAYVLAKACGVCRMHAS